MTAIFYTEKANRRLKEKVKFREELRYDRDARKCESRTRQHISGTITPLALASLFFSALSASSTLADDWPQFQGNALRSGNAPQVVMQTPLGLIAAIR